MRIFVTGATGFVGSAIVRELLSAGHQVLGLARTESAAASLETIGVRVQRGSIEDLESLRRGALAADAVVHTAFNHDFSRFKQSCEEDARTIEALGDALAGTTRPLVVTSALGALRKGTLLTEDATVAPGPDTHPRAATEGAADAVAARGVRVSVVRLPPSVHGEGDPQFVSVLIQHARTKRASAYLDPGENCWSAVHRLDAAKLYRTILESRPEGGRYHAVAEEGIRFRDLATTIGQQLGVPVISIARGEASSHFGWLGDFAAMDLRASSAHTRERLGWTPKHVGLIEDLKQGHYFAS